MISVSQRQQSPCFLPDPWWPGEGQRCAVRLPVLFCSQGIEGSSGMAIPDFWTDPDPMERIQQTTSVRYQSFQMIQSSTALGHVSGTVVLVSILVVWLHSDFLNRGWQSASGKECFYRYFKVCVVPATSVPFGEGDSSRASRATGNRFF